MVAGKEALEGDLGQGLGGGRGPAALLQLDEAVQAAGPHPPGRGAAGDLVDDLDLAVPHQVVHVPVVGVPGRQRHADHLLAQARRTPAPAQRLRPLGQPGLAGRAELDPARRPIDREVPLRRKPAGELPGLPEEGPRSAALHLPRQDQGHHRLVDQEAVGLVDHRHAQAAEQRPGGLAVPQRGRPARQVAAREARPSTVAQIVEDQLAGGDVADRLGVGRPAGCLVVGPDHEAGPQPEARIHRREPRRIPLHQIVVGGEHMHRHAGQRANGRRQGRREGLALAGGHLGEAAVEHHQRRLDLAVVGRQAQAAPGRLDGGGQGFDETAGGQAVPPHPRLHGPHAGEEAVVGERPPARAGRPHRLQLAEVGRPPPRPAHPRRRPALGVSAPHEARQRNPQIEGRAHQRASQRGARLMRTG